MHVMDLTLEDSKEAWGMGLGYVGLHIRVCGTATVVVVQSIQHKGGC